MDRERGLYLGYSSMLVMGAWSFQLFKLESGFNFS